MQFQLSKRCGLFQPAKQIIFTVLLVLAFTANSRAQGFNPIEKLKEVTDQLEKIVLDRTAISDKDENEIGKYMAERIEKDMTEGRSAKYDVDKIFKQLKAQVQRKQINYRYEIVQNKEVNAFTIAGGKVYINTGLLNAVENENELAFVIGHELAHNEKKHCIRKIQVAIAAGQINPTLGQVVGKAYQIYRTPFEKYEEFDADDLGAKLMMKAGYNIDGAISFFKKLEELEKKYGMDKRGGLNDFISSHPHSKERGEKMKQLKAGK